MLVRLDCNGCQAAAIHRVGYLADLRRSRKDQFADARNVVGLQAVELVGRQALGSNSGLAHGPDNRQHRVAGRVVDRQGLDAMTALGKALSLPVILARSTVSIAECFACLVLVRCVAIHRSAASSNVFDTARAAALRLRGHVLAPPAPTSPPPGPSDLGRLLRQLHQIDPPPVSSPVYRPLVPVRQAIESSHVIDEDERAWLRNRCEELLASYDQLSFPLPAGLIHGDAWQGNLLRDGPRVVLADWDEVSTGPREIDLIPTLQGTRFGLPQAQRDAFIAAYGHDIRTWDGYRILCEISGAVHHQRAPARRQRKRGWSNA